MCLLILLSVVALISELLGVPVQALIKVLTNRTVTASRGENYDVPLNNEQASYAIDAFAKGTDNIGVNVSNYFERFI